MMMPENAHARKCARDTGQGGGGVMNGYLRRLTRDLDRWIAGGLVPAQNRQAILDSASVPRAGWTASGAAAILGAVLLALAALSFTAANWPDLPRLARFTVIIAALWASFAGAAFAFARGNPAAGHALALLGAALFGAAIALTAQTFNMSAFRNTGVLIWAGAALVTALAIPSRPVLALAALLGALWAGMEAGNPLVSHAVWGYAPFWFLTAAAAVRLRSLAAMNLLAAGLLVWTGHILFETGRDVLTHAQHIAAFTLIAGALAMTAALARDRAVFGAGVISGWAGAGAALGVLTLQAALGYTHETAGGSALYAVIAGGALAVIAATSAWRVRTQRLALWPALALAGTGLMTAALPFAHAGRAGGLEVLTGALIYAAAAALILIGARLGRRFTGGLGVALFVLQSLYVYTRLFGDLLNTALLFFIGGLVLFAVSFLITRLQKRLASDEGARS